MALGIITAYFFNTSHQSVCIPPIVARRRLGKKFTAATNRDAKVELLEVVFYGVRVVSKESRRLILPRTSCCITPVLNYVTKAYWGVDI
jgi:hypothetical protein